MSTFDAFSVYDFFTWNPVCSGSGVSPKCTVVAEVIRIASSHFGPVKPPGVASLCRSCAKEDEQTLRDMGARQRPKTEPKKEVGRG